MSEYICTSFTDWNWGLAHHGIRGQKWGVRRFQNPDGTLTAAGKAHYRVVTEGGSRRLGAAYNRQLKKLNRLRDKADIDKQKAIAEKYDKRSKTAMKVGSVAGGMALAGALSQPWADDVRWHLAADAYRKSQDRQYDAIKAASNKHTEEWIRADDINRMFPDGSLKSSTDALKDRAYQKYADTKEALKKEGANERAGIINRRDTANAIHRYATYAAAGAAAVAGGYAAYAGIRSKMAKTRMTDAGHAKAVQKYKQQYEKMMNEFQDTPYSELIKEQNRKNKNSIRS